MVDLNKPLTKDIIKKTLEERNWSNFWINDNPSILNFYSTEQLKYLYENPKYIDDDILTHFKLFKELNLQ